MPFTIEAPRMDQPPKGPAAIVADRRLYLAADERTMLEDGDENVRFLLVAAGSSISGPDVARLKLSLVDGRVVQDAPEKAEAPTEPEKVEALVSEKAEVPSEPEKVEAPEGATDPKPTGKREKK